MQKAVLMREKLISVIVPIYKVEQYLEKCVDSILAQTHKNLEIILIDDGSPDNCGRICDEYKIRDNRIQVIHQPNGGLSAARNSGLNIASGEYIGFVDSDDWIEPNMYEHLMDVMEQNRADIVQCGVCVDDDNSAGNKPPLKVIEGSKEIFEHAACGRMSLTVWCNLYKADLWTDLRFAEGFYYEDAIIFPEIMQRCAKWVYINQKLYHYNRHNGGIVRMEKNMMHLKSKEKVADVYVRLYSDKPEYKNITAFYLCGLIANYRWLIFANSKIDRSAAKTHRKALHKIFRNCFKDANTYANYKEVSLAKRAYWRLYDVSPLVAGMLLRIIWGRQ